MGNANVAFTDLEGLTGAGFPNMSEFETQQQYPGSQSGSDGPFKSDTSKSLALPRVLEKSAIVATSDSSVLHGKQKAGCDLPFANLGRALELLTSDPTGERPYGPDEIELLSQVAGQIAIAIDKAMGYDEVSELKDKLAQEKLYLEDEIRSEMNFEEIIGKSAALRHVLKEVETVGPTESTVLIYGETGTGKELIARAIHNAAPAIPAPL